MQRKLTLRLDEEAIRKAKAHARRTGRSVSSLVEEYFERLEAAGEGEDVELSPVVRSLVGCLEGADVDEGDYRRYLEEKHA